MDKLSNSPSSQLTWRIYRKLYCCYLGYKYGNVFVKVMDVLGSKVWKPYVVTSIWVVYDKV